MINARRTSLGVLLRSLAVVAGTLVFTIFLGCGGEGRDGPAGPKVTPLGELVAIGSKGHFRFKLKLDPSPPVLSDYFSVWTRVERLKGDRSLVSGDLSLDATMPDHEHGMTTLPRTRMHEEGVFRTTGCRFHMHGRWVFALSFKTQGVVDHARIEFPFHPAPVKR